MWDNTQQKHGPLSVDLESLSNNRKMGRLVICRRQAKLRVYTLLQKNNLIDFNRPNFTLNPYSPKILNSILLMV